MKDKLMKIHYAITAIMAKSWIVENLLIAKVEEDGEVFDCIYCTILRNAVLFGSVGFLIGCILGYLVGVQWR